VDNDADIAVMLARILTHLGHDAVACSEPAKAIEKLGFCGGCTAPRGCSGVFDVVLADYLMEPDGITLLKAYEGIARHRILITASYATVEIRNAMLDEIVHVVLTKPATIAEIKFAIDAANDPR
jgi:CheY-like chemotaxis protein